METTNYLLQCTSAIVSAHLAQNSVKKTKELTNIISAIFLTLRRLSALELKGANSTEPAIAISESIHPDYIVCLEDGKKLKMLKRHLKTFYNLSIEDYKKKWGLSENYPVVAPNYAKKRSKLAKNMGLGKKSLINDNFDNLE